MKRIQKFTVIFLCILFVSSSFCLDAFADNRDLHENVDISELSDVTEADWFYYTLKNLMELNIIHGRDDKTFLPRAPISRCEFIKTLVCAIGTDDLSDEDIEIYDRLSKNPAHWSEPYFYLANIMLIFDEDEYETADPEEYITRADMARYIVNALGITNDSQYSPFCDDADANTLRLYREYLILGRRGDDGKLYSDPSANCSRAEACEIISRTFDYLTNPYKYKRNQLLKRKNDGLDAEFEIADFFLVTAFEFEDMADFESALPIDKICDIYIMNAKMYPDIFLYDSISYRFTDGTTHYFFKFQYTEDINELRQKRDASIAAAKLIIKENISDDMTELEKLIFIHDYIVLCTEYDIDGYLAADIEKSCFRPWGVFENGLAVCQGYSAAFNMLCREAGIKAHTLVGYKISFDSEQVLHAWNVALVDGDMYFYDTTHDDPVRQNTLRHTYCQMDKETHDLYYQYEQDLLDLSLFDNILN